MKKYQHTFERRRLSIPKTPRIMSRTPLLPHAEKLIPTILIGMIAILGITYVIKMNFVAAKGFELKNVERHVVELQETQKKLQIKLAQKESLAGLSEEIQTLGMVPVQDVEYFVTSGGTVAVR